MLSPSVFYLLRINHRNARDFDRFVSALVASQTARPRPGNLCCSGSSGSGTCMGANSGSLPGCTEDMSVPSRDRGRDSALIGRP